MGSTRQRSILLTIPEQTYLYIYSTVLPNCTRTVLWIPHQYTSHTVFDLREKNKMKSHNASLSPFILSVLLFCMYKRVVFSTYAAAISAVSLSLFFLCVSFLFDCR